MLEDGRARLEVGARGRPGRSRPAAHARAPRRQRQDPRLPQGQGAAGGRAAAHGPRGSLRGDDARVPARLGRRGDRGVPPAAGRPAERRFRGDPGRGRAVHVHGRVPAAAHGHAARDARDRGRAGGRSTFRPTRSTPSSSDCARSPRRSSRSSAPRRPATSSRSTCTSARAASRCPRRRRSATSCSSATAARSRRSSARCAA